MAIAATLFTIVTALAGAIFCTAGTLGLLRFGDLRSRLHALAKADTVGLGFVVLSLLPWADSLAAALKLVLVWLLALAAASASAHVLASRVPHESEGSR